MLDKQLKKKVRKLILVPKLLLIACCTMGAFTLAASERSEFLLNQTFDLVNAESAGFFSPKESLKITVPPSFDHHQRQNITVELNAVDITEMIQLTNGQLIYTPLQPMSAETLELRLTTYTNEGNLIELGVWQVNVRMSELFEKYTFSADSQLNSNYRVSEKNAGAPLPDRLESDANSQIGFKLQNGNWLAEGQFDLNYISVKENRPSDRAIENSEFLLNVGNQFVTAKIGHQNIENTSMVMDNFRRRGISVQGKIPSLRSTVTGFSLSSIDISGFGHGLGISNSQQRVNGYSISSTPFSESPGLLSLSTTWISGRGNDNGSFVSNFDEYGDPNLFNPPSEKGDSWSLAAESRLFDDKLRVSVEYAATKFDFNPADNITEEKDNAKNILVNYADITESGMSWNAGLNYQKIGAFFKSMANRGLPSDKQLSKIFAGSQWETVSIQFNVEKQQDNLNNLEILPTTLTDSSSVNLTWSPIFESTDNWFGTPNFNLGFNQQGQQQNKLPDEYFFPASNNQLHNLQLSSSFNYESNSWGLTFMQTTFVDKSKVQNDSNTTSINLFTSFNFDEVGNFSPSVQMDQTKDIITQLTSLSLTYSLQSSFIILPNQLNGSASIIYNQNESSDLLTDGDSLAFSLALNWNVQEAAPNQLGIEVSLSGMYNDFNDNLFVINSIETSQIFLTATFSLPTLIGQTD